jgi:guanylate kinase
MLEQLPAEGDGLGTARGRVFILTGPSGVGKDTVTNALKAGQFPLSFCVTATTRPPRSGEHNGVHYFFYSADEFERMRAADELLEWAQVHENMYGIPRWQVRDGLRRGQDIMITVDVQGGETLRRKLPGAVFIFLAPPSLEELRARLTIRGTENLEQIDKRLQTAVRELEYWKRYDYLVRNYNDRVDEAVEQVQSIIMAERLRVNPRFVTL